eukprot:TRINITY_DN139_c1_g1_i1.p1 TRINITY_DN139_c1_g1~~TRINITY_DN139_c1_g1_i1.p1  ORF type:complete len:415 (+),score=98.42 TRINITY_DN139_c1_g1_i1:2-1246(+)
MKLYKHLSKTKNSKIPIKAWTTNVPLEDMAYKQVQHLSEMDIVYPHVALMPDAHWGKGTTIGSVIPTRNAVIPAAVGVDIGCGMCAVKTSMTANVLPDSLRGIRNAIEEIIPVGNSSYGDKKYPDVGKEPLHIWDSLKPRFDLLTKKHPELLSRKKYKDKHEVSQLGTLGGGNHFIEVCLDESDNVWLMLHSGSRNVGNRMGNYFIALAKKEMERLFPHHELPDKDLSYFQEGTEYFDDYFEGVSWAQDYAKYNREVMMNQLISVLRNPKNKLPEFSLEEQAVNCHHNYVQREEHFGESLLITRKGAVSAKKDQLGIIPGSMGTSSYIVRGLGNSDSFDSCSHGAGRSMSRIQAKKKFSISEHVQATEGVECRKDRHVIDETPAAYKNIDDVMEAQKDLVEIVHKLKQVIVVKG